LRPDNAGILGIVPPEAPAGLEMICSLVTQLSIRVLLRADSPGDFVRMLRVVLHGTSAKFSFLIPPHRIFHDGLRWFRLP
jgi:hypothetical protein